MAVVTCAVTAPAITGGSPITGYVLQRRAGNGAWADLASLPATAFTYVDSTPSGGVQYGYRVAAVNAIGTGPFSAEALVTVPVAPAPAPTATVLALGFYIQYDNPQTAVDAYRTWVAN